MKKKISQQNELIKVNLNEYKESLYEESDSEDLDIEDDMGEGERRFENFSEGSKELETEEKISKESESSINKDEIEIFEESEKKESKESKENEKIDISSLIMEQDSIEGSWSENEETKKLIKIISEDKIIKINNRIKQLYEGENQDKIKYTILVIYYLNNNHSDKLNEYKLIINKAKSFLKSKGLKYEYIIEF